MKKIYSLLLFVLLALGAAPASAQGVRFQGMEWGALAGANYTDFSIQAVDMNAQGGFGYHLGIDVAFDLGPFAVEPQLIYVRRNARIGREGFDDLKIKSNALEVPLLLSVRALPVLRINVGPSFSVMNDSKFKDGDGTMPMGRLAPTVSYVIGVGLQLGRHTVIDLRYNGRFTSKKVIYPYDSTPFTLRSDTWMVSLGIVF